MVDRDAVTAAKQMVGARVELHPGLDLWVRGARFGVVVGHVRGTAKVRVKLDATGKTVKLPADRLTEI